VNNPNRTLEFIFLVALLNALTAMSIDTMLPAIGVIASELGAADPNNRQFIITALFAGMTLGTLIYGPLSDSIGRKPSIFIGLVIFAAGSLTCLFATTFPVMLIGRLIQGFGAASPRFVSTAMVRDGLAGSAMARVMSFVMTVFMLVPILAPSIGQLVLIAFHWRFIFAGFFVMAVVAGVWLGVRQEETLPASRRIPFSVSNLVQSGLESFRHPVTLGYTLAMGLVFSSLIAYLGTSQQIFAELYGQGPLFALWFASFAIALAISTIVNGRFVVRLGMRTITKWALRASILFSFVFLAIASFFGGLPPLWMLGVYLFANFFCLGLLFGNYNALSLEPVGHIAGMASAVSGFTYSVISMVGGTLVGQTYNNTVIPLASGFLGFGLLAFVASEWAERQRKKM
jgi:MFS transporter, DHA1 family, multidrug resistance protein